MMWISKRLLLIGLATAVWTAGLSTASLRAEEKDAPSQVIYGGSSWLGHYPVWVGIESGVFEKKGLDVAFRQFYTSSGRMGALMAGNIDFASTGAISGIALMAAGAKTFHVLASQDSYATVEGIIAGKRIQSVSDLRGKKLAVTFASSAHVLVLDVLEQHGLDPQEDVDLINLKVSEMVAAFQTGEVDACAAWTPMFNKILALPGARLLLDDTHFSLYRKYGLGPGPDMLVVRKRFYEENRPVSRRFLEGYFESIRMLRSRPEVCARLLISLTQLSLDQQQQVLKDITWHGLEEQRELMIRPGRFVQGLQKLAEFLDRHGQIDRSPTVEQWVNTGWLP